MISIDLSEDMDIVCPAMCMVDDERSDIKLVVLGQKIPAHKVVLKTNSEYFNKMLSPPFEEATQSEIELADIPSLESFRAIITYIYSGEIKLSVNDKMVRDVFMLANKYGFSQLETELVDELCNQLNMNNILDLYDMSTTLNLDKLKEACLNYIDENAADILSKPELEELPVHLLKSILERDTFDCDEMEIHELVVRWSKKDFRNDELKWCIRLGLISQEDIFKIVSGSGLFSMDDFNMAGKHPKTFEERFTPKCSHGGDFKKCGFTMCRHQSSCLQIGDFVRVCGDLDLIAESGFGQLEIDSSEKRQLIGKVGQVATISETGKGIQVNNLWFDFQHVTKIKNKKGIVCNNCYKDY